MKANRNLQHIAFFIVFALLTGPVTGQSKYDKMIIKTETQYVLGNYAKAAKFNAKLLKKVSKKEGLTNNYIAKHYLIASKLDLATGQLVNFEGDITQAMSVSIRANGENSLPHARNLIQACETYLRFGNYVKAITSLDQAKAIVEENNALDGDLKAEIDLNYARIYSGQGFYSKALELIETFEDHFKGRAVQKESYVDESGKLKTRRLSEDEYFSRAKAYASLLTLKAVTLTDQGDVFEADKVFNNADGWITKNLGRNHLEFAENAFQYGRWFDVTGSLTNDAEKNYRQALTSIKKEHTESHYLALDIYESLLKSYLLSGDRPKYKNLKNEYERVIKKYFQRSSMHYVNLNTIEFDAKLNKDKARNLETQATNILSNNFSIPQFHKKRAQLMEFMYQAALQNRVYLNGENYLVEINNVNKELYGESAPVYHLSRIRLANHYLDYTNKLDEALEIYNESYYGIVEPQIKFAHYDLVEILNHLAKYYEGNDNYDLANETLDQAREIVGRKYQPDDYEYGIELEKIAALKIRLGEYDAAEEAIAEAINILVDERRSKENVIYFVQGLETRAKLNAIKGEFDDAESDLQRSKRLLRRAESTVLYDELGTIEELADLNIMLGRYSTTQELLERVIGEKEKLYGPNSRNLVNALNDMAKLFLIKGDYTEAEKYARRADDIAEATFGSESTKTAPSLIILSEIYTTIGDYDKAEENIVRAIAIQESRFGREHIDVANSLSQLGLIKFYKGDDPKAIEELFNEAKTIIEKKLGNRSPSYAEILKELAVLYIAEQRYDDAFNSLTLAQTIWETKVGRRNNINVASIYIMEGDIYYQQRSFEKAEEKYDLAKKLYERFFNDNHPEYVKVLSKLSKVYYMEGDLKRSKRLIEEAISNYDTFIKEYFPALSEREKAKFWNTIRPDYEFYNTIGFRMLEDDPKVIENIYNNALNTKAILLNSSIKIRTRILGSGDEELINQYNEWLRKKELLTAALSMGKDQLIENELDLPILTEEVELLEKEISQKSEIFGSSFEKGEITWEDVRESLKANEVAIEMIRYRYFDHIFSDSVVYAGMYLKNDDSQKRPEFFTIGNGYELETRYFKFYRNSIIYQVDDRFSYDAYWKPIIDKVGASATMYISADGVYNQINLEAIPTGDGKYVIDNSNIILVSNTKDIYLRAHRTGGVESSKTAMMFGNPTFYTAANATKKSGIGQLPGTEREINELKGLLADNGWSTDDYINLSASEGQVKELNSPKVFHIATHGFFTPSKTIEENQSILTQSEAAVAENPLLRTGLLMRGAGDLLDKTAFNYNMEAGILTAYEAMNLNLDQTELVVLSACETGLGDVKAGEGVYGLQRAFMVAGARTLIMSIFKVNDEATQKLMTTFYRKWLETGNKRQSFIEAKIELRNDPRFKDPKFWGAFIMLGID